MNETLNFLLIVIHPISSLINKKAVPAWIAETALLFFMMIKSLFI